MLANLSEFLDRSGAWDRWRSLDDRLAEFDSLDDLVALGSARAYGPSGSELGPDRRRYSALAALAGIASSRGHDDDDAALAVVSVLRYGVGALAYRLRDRCELDDVIVGVWERAKAVEPEPGPRVADFLLRRAHAHLVRETAALVADRDAESLDQYEFDIREVGVWDVTIEDRPITEVVDLLAWAREHDVLRPLELSVLVELLDLERSGVPRAERNARVGARVGRTSRSIFRLEERAIARLRDAVATAGVWDAEVAA